MQSRAAVARVPRPVHAAGAGGAAARPSRSPQETTLTPGPRPPASPARVPAAPRRAPGRALVLGVTADHAFAAGAAVAGLRAQDPAPGCDLVVFHDGLGASDRAALAALWPGVEFARFGRRRVLERLGLERVPPRLARLFARFSPLHLAKLELPALLEGGRERCVWLDADLMVQGPWTPLWDFPCLAWRALPAGAFARRAEVLAALADLPRDPAVPLLNGGVLGVSAELTQRLPEAGRTLWALARRLLETTTSPQIDEMAWYLLAAGHGLPVKPYPRALNHPATAPGAGGAAIVHAIGPRKFWNAPELAASFPAWAEHAARWRAAGGAPYAGPMLPAPAPAP